MHFDVASWIAKIGEKEVPSLRRILICRDIKMHLPKLFFYTMGIMAIYFVANKYAGAVPIERNFYWAAVSILIFPLFIGFAYWLDKIVWEGFVLNVVRSKAEINKAKETGEFFHNASRFVVILIT